MKRLNQRGIVDAWLLAFVFTLLVLFGAIAFGVWAFSERQDYKNKVDGKISVAVDAAKKELSQQKEVEFAEKEKQPLRTYNGPAAYGSLSLSFPKTWSAYVDESGASSAPLNGYLNPNFVPSVQNGSFALRFQIINAAYASTIQSLSGQITAGKIQTKPFVADKVKGTIGLRVDGQVGPEKQGAMVILPLRDKTLKIWTESTQFVPDFDNIILPNLNFIP